MTCWRRISPVARRLVAVAVLAVFTEATALAAAEPECEHADSSVQDCFSELLSECWEDVARSWNECLDPDGDGSVDVGITDSLLCGLEGVAGALYCPIEAAMRLLADVS